MHAVFITAVGQARHANQLHSEPWECAAMFPIYLLSRGLGIIGIDVLRQAPIRLRSTCITWLLQKYAACGSSGERNRSLQAEWSNLSHLVYLMNRSTTYKNSDMFDIAGLRFFSRYTAAGTDINEDTSDVWQWHFGKVLAACFTINTLWDACHVFFNARHSSLKVKT